MVIEQIRSKNLTRAFYRYFTPLLKFPNIKIEVSDRKGDSKPDAEVSNKLREVVGCQESTKKGIKWENGKICFKGDRFCEGR